MTTIIALFAAILFFLAIREHRAWRKEHERTVRRLAKYNERLIDMLLDEEG